MNSKLNTQKKKLNSKLSSKEAACYPSDDNLIIGILVIITVGIIAMVVDVAAEKPPSIKFKITEASITQFDITSDNTLYYNFKVTITAKNYKNEIKYFEKKMDAISSYKGNQLSSMTMEPFVLGNKNTVTLQPIVFEGNSLIRLVPKELVEYNNETQLGIYNLQFELSPFLYCSLRIPLISNDKLTPTFNVTECQCSRYSTCFD
jgi:hypothetical protein